jgi:transcriptional regulator with XRE-family HTH domain
MSKDVGSRIAALRGRRTQTDLASALRLRGFGTTQTTVSRWESGQAPRGSVLPALAAELGVTVDELLSVSDDDEEAAAMQPLGGDIMQALNAAIDRAVAARMAALAAAERKEEVQR